MATAERSFSTIRRLETYLRSSSSENINGLALLSIHRDVHVTDEKVSELFANIPRNLIVNVQLELP